MEAAEILKMTEDAFQNRCYIIDVIISDDNSTMWSVLKNKSIGARGKFMK